MIEYTVKVYPNGNRFWFNKDGDPHCEHGPAIVLGRGHERYYLNGERLTKEEWEKRLGKKPSVTKEDVEKARAAWAAAGRVRESASWSAFVAKIDNHYAEVDVSAALAKYIKLKEDHNSL